MEAVIEEKGEVEGLGEIFPVWQRSLCLQPNLRQAVKSYGASYVAIALQWISQAQVGVEATVYFLKEFADQVPENDRGKLFRIPVIKKNAEVCSRLLREVARIPEKIKAELIKVIVESKSPRLAFLTVYYNDKNPITGEDKVRLLQVVFLVKEPEWAYLCCLAMAERAEGNLWQIPPEDKAMFHCLEAVVIGSKDKKWLFLFYRYVYGFPHAKAHFLAYGK